MMGIVCSESLKTVSRMPSRNSNILIYSAPVANERLTNHPALHSSSELSMRVCSRMTSPLETKALESVKVKPQRLTCYFVH